MQHAHGTPTRLHTGQFSLQPVLSVMAKSMSELRAILHRGLTTAFKGSAAISCWAIANCPGSAALLATGTYAVASAMAGLKGTACLPPCDACLERRPATRRLACSASLIPAGRGRAASTGTGGAPPDCSRAAAVASRPATVAENELSCRTALIYALFRVHSGWQSAVSRRLRAHALH